MSVNRLLRKQHWLLGFFLLLQSSCLLADAKFSLSPERGEVPIVWASSSRPAPLPPLEHAANLLPIRLAALPEREFLMQFDLGRSDSVLYLSKWSDIAERIKRVDAKKRVSTLDFQLGDMAVKAENVVVIKHNGPGINWESEQPEVIGTIGADLIDGRTVVMDFAADRITLARSREGLVETNARFFPFTFNGRRLLLPATMEDKTVDVMYDSGSSAFSWLTAEKTAMQLARAEAKAISYPVRSWNDMLTAYTVATDAKVSIAGVELALKEVSWIEGMGLLQRMGIARLGLGGMVGNKLFLGRRLIIDTTKLEFAIEEVAPAAVP